MEPEITDLRGREWTLDWSIGNSHVPRGLMEKYGFNEIVREQDRGYEACLNYFKREKKFKDDVLKVRSEAKRNKRVYTVDVKSADALSNVDFAAEALWHFLGGKSSVGRVDGNLLLSLGPYDDGLMFGPVVSLLDQVLDGVCERLPVGKTGKVDAGNKINSWHVQPNLDEYYVTVTDKRHFSYRLELDRWVVQACQVGASFAGFLELIATHPLAREIDRQDALRCAAPLAALCETARDTWRSRFLNHF